MKPFKIRFKGQQVQIVEERIRAKNRDGESHYYEIRHSDSDIDDPVSVESVVFVNFWGTMTTKLPLDFKGKKDIIITDAIKSKIRDNQG